jgi:hypothetical protein
MNKKFSSAILIVCLVAIGVEVRAQETKPVVFTVYSKIMTAKIRCGETDQVTVQGRTAFTLTAANEDDTLTGVLVYSVSETERERIAQLTGAEPKEVPTNFIKKDVTANFRKGTACPIAHLVIPSAEIEIEGAMIHLDRVMMEINETHGPMPQLLCAWVRQVNTKHQRHGIIAAINRLIRGEE